MDRAEIEKQWSPDGHVSTFGVRPDDHRKVIVARTIHIYGRVSALGMRPDYQRKVIPVGTQRLDF